MWPLHSGEHCFRSVCLAGFTACIRRCDDVFLCCCTDGLGRQQKNRLCYSFLWHCGGSGFREGHSSRLWLLPFVSAFEKPTLNMCFTTQPGQLYSMYCVIRSNLASYGLVYKYCKSTGPHNQLISYQIKSLLLSHHHSTSALVSEILKSVLQTVQKKKNNFFFTYGQYTFTDYTEDNVQNTHTYNQYT